MARQVSRLARHRHRPDPGCLAAIKLGLLPPYRPGLWPAIPRGWRLRPARRRGGLRVAARGGARGGAGRLREPLPVQRHRTHAAPRGLRAARPARPARRLAARTDPHPARHRILVLPEHHPLQLAKRCATIDRLSAGRLFLGVGVGWMREEVAALGIDPDERGSRTDEAIDALRVIWHEDEPTFAASTSASARCAATPSRCSRPSRSSSVATAGPPPDEPANAATASSPSAWPAMRWMRWTRRSRRSLSKPAGPGRGDADDGRPPRRRRDHERARPRRRAGRPPPGTSGSRRAPPRHGHRVARASHSTDVGPGHRHEEGGREGEAMPATWIRWKRSLGPVGARRCSPGRARRGRRRR